MYDMPAMNADNLLAFVTLTIMEIVLGVDNVVFIAILSGKLPLNQQRRARLVGLGLAMLMRVGFLFAISWILTLQAPLFEVLDQQVTWKDIILIAGGTFLIGKATWEIHHQINVQESEKEGSPSPGQVSFTSVIFQILLLDAVFSIDSVLTAVGMAKNVWIMVVAVVISVIVMMVFSGPIARFIEKHSTVKMLALSFLILIGVMLVVEGSSDTEVSKGYVYFAMGFSIFVELLQMGFRAKRRIRTKAAVESVIKK